MLFLLKILAAALAVSSDSCDESSAAGVKLDPGLQASVKACLAQYFADNEGEGPSSCGSHLNGHASEQLLSALAADKSLDAAFSAGVPEMSHLHPPAHCAPQTYRDFIDGNGCASDGPFQDSCLRLVESQGKFPSVGFLLKANSGVSEGYSIRCHAERVLEIFDQQRKFVKNGALDELADQLKIPRGKLLPLLRLTFALHDIGKPLAVMSDTKQSREELFSAPLIELLLEKAGYAKREARLGAALVDGHQLLGLAARGMLPAQTVRKIIDPLLTRGKDSFAIAPYLALLEKLYIADASSYPYVCQLLFPAEKEKGEQAYLGGNPLDIDSLMHGKYPDLRQKVLIP